MGYTLDDREAPAKNSIETAVPVFTYRDHALVRLLSRKAYTSWNHAGFFNVPGETMRGLCTEGLAMHRKRSPSDPMEYRVVPGAPVGAAARSACRAAADRLRQRQRGDSVSLSSDDDQRGAEPSRLAWHLTPSDNVEAILREGLRPMAGPRHRLIAEDPPEIDLFPSALSMVTFTTGDFHNGLCSGSMALIEVSVLDSQLSSPFKSSLTEPDWSLCTREPIPPSNLKILRAAHYRPGMDYPGEDTPIQWIEPYPLRTIKPIALDRPRPGRLR